MVLAMLAALVGCDEGSADTGEAAVPAGPEVWVVLEWDDGDLTVPLDVGYALTFSVELLPCAEPVAWTPGALVFGQAAHAGHGLTGADALRSLRAPRVESLTARHASPLGHLTPEAGAYCEIFWLMSFTTAAYDTVGLPDDVDMLGDALSVYAAGPGVAAAASTGRGARLPIVDKSGQPAPIEIEAGGAGEILRIVRDPTSLMADIDLSGAPEDVGAAMLENLLGSARAVRDH